jgi:hypothetical protein
MPRAESSAEAYRRICARPVRRVGMSSMGPLSAMGVKLQMVEDPHGTE